MDKNNNSALSESGRWKAFISDNILDLVGKVSAIDTRTKGLPSLAEIEESMDKKIKSALEYHSRVCGLERQVESKKTPVDTKIELKQKSEVIKWAKIIVGICLAVGSTIAGFYLGD